MPSIPPASFSPASAFELVGQAAQQDPVAILADLIDPDTGDFEAIDESATIADGLVVQLLRVQRDSGAAVLGFGQRFREVRNVDTGTPELVDSLAREALQPARDAGIVEFQSLSSAVNPSDPTQTDTTIEYLDLLAPKKDSQQKLTFTE